LSLRERGTQPSINSSCGNGRGDGKLSKSFQLEDPMLYVRKLVLSEALCRRVVMPSP